jgi:hypothetical protein
MVTAVQVKQVHDKNSKISKSWRTRMKDFVDIVFANQTAIATLNYETTEAIVATTGGATTGLISAATEFANVTTDSINKQISLPAAVEGKKLKILVAATGCEMISVVAGDKVNTVVVGATNEAALVAGTTYSLEYDGTDNWIMTGLTAAGAVETEVTPDSL